MVKGEQEHADEPAEDEVHAIEEKQGGGLLRGDDIEKAVHHLRCVHFIMHLRLHAWEAVGEVRCGAHKDATLNHV